MMPDDEKILRSVWGAKLPIRFQLAQEDLVREDLVPTPFYVLVPRISYFPLLIDRVIRYFIDFTEYAPHLNENTKESAHDCIQSTEVGVEASQAFESAAKPMMTADQRLDTIPPEQRVWLEYEHQPLKWHYPIGLLFDLHTDGTELPWNVTVHFHNYPSDILLSPPVHRRAIEIHFMSVVKEADALKHRSQVMNQMQARDHHQIWTGILNYNFQQYWDINRRLMEPVAHTTLDGHSRNSPVTAGLESDSDVTAAAEGAPVALSLKTFRNIPCRLYRAGKTRGEYTTGYVQKRIQPCTNDGVFLTVLDVAKKLLFLSDTEEDVELKVTEYAFLLHGICLPHETPIQWVCEHMAYADNFVHLVAWPRSRPNRALTPV